MVGPSGGGDPSSSAYACQKCSAPLEVVGDAPPEAPHNRPSPLDESFVVLPSEAQGGGQPTLGRGRGPGARLALAPGGQATLLSAAAAVGSVPPGAGGAAGPGRRGVEESFIVLPGARGGAGVRGAAGSSGLQGSWASPAGAHQGGGGLGSQQQQQQQGPRVHWDARSESLRRVFELATEQTQVDHPLCMECASALREELELQVSEAEHDILLYTRCLADLEAEGGQALGEEEFRAQLEALEAEEVVEAGRLDALEGEVRRARGEREGLEEAERELAGLEERYWHDFNDFQLQLRAHLEERDGMLARMEGACAQLELLKGTNVYNDAFHIWHDGAFGTINGFRLGRLPGVPVGWDEINAAWGQACLLLHTMAQACKLTFSTYRLLPMGSYPRVACNGAVYELCGPVNFLWNQRNYDKAMTCFLACLREFAEFAKARDEAHGRAPPFELPYRIEGDRVGGRSIRQGFPNKDEKWTAALQWMLTDLKVALSWLCSV